MNNVFTFNAKTPDEVRKVLTNAYHSGRRIRVFYGDVGTGLAWMEEHEVCGAVGRSTGITKVPLLIARKDGDGGPAMLDHCIVRIDYTDTKKTAYRHPKLDIGTFRIAPSTETGYTDSVYVLQRERPETLIANFKSHDKAQRYIDFMTGKRYNK